tara:strand:+ start:1837 stop:2061 length:225 start_codon:yes stop_codon:yes gene_type:complete
MEPSLHIFLPESGGNTYGNFDVTASIFVLYNGRTNTAYPIDGDEVIKLMGKPNVTLSKRAKAKIDTILKAAYAA